MTAFDEDAAQTTSTAGDEVIRRGKLLAYRVFDVASAIALDAAERKLAERGGGRRVRLGRTGTAEVMVFASRPLEVALGRRALRLRGGAYEADVFARIFAYGALSISFELHVEPGTTFNALAPLCAEIYDGPALEEAGRIETEALLAALGDAATAPKVWGGVETYTVLFVEELDGAPTPARLRSSDALARLLLGELTDKPLSRPQRDDVLGAALSYFNDDLVVIDWNSAFVLEPGGGREIPQILEFATSQLLEHRYYDGLLDLELLRTHDAVALARPRFLLIRSPYNALAREALRRLIELGEFTERVDNALKVIGDFYLARVYQAAVRRFRITAWQASLREKKELVRQAYELLKGDVDSERGTALEVIVLLLILIEVVHAFVRR
jgi:hypothetical protein